MHQRYAASTLHAQDVVAGRLAAVSQLPPPLVPYGDQKLIVCMRWIRDQVTQVRISSLCVLVVFAGGRRARPRTSALTSRARHSVRVAGFVALPDPPSPQRKTGTKASSLIVLWLPSESRLHVRAQSCASMGVLLWVGGEWWLIRGRRFE